MAPDEPSEPTEREFLEGLRPEDEPASEPVMIACVRVEGSGSVYPGSVRRRCCDCRAEVWVSPASVRALRERVGEVVCLACASDRLERDPHPEVGILPGTAREVGAWLRRN